MITVLKIDVTRKEIYPVQIEDGINAIYKEMKCSCFAVPITYSNNDALYVDDEVYNKTINGGFIFPDWHSPILNDSLIIGCDEEGASKNAESHPDDFDNIKWLSSEQCINYLNNLG